MRWLRGLTVASRLYVLVALLALAAVAMGLLGLHGMRGYGLKVAEMRNASQRAIMGERVNTLIYAAVMDSRGIYMARNQAEAEKFGKPLLASLEAIGKTLGDWKALLPEARRPELAATERDIRDFVVFRRELVRLGEEVGNPTARDYGDNDANRANRSALNREIQALAAANAREISRLSDEADQFYRVELALMAGVALAVLAVIGAAVLFVRRGLVRPVATLTEAMRRLTDRDMTVVIPGADRHDELGVMAAAVVAFRDGMLAADRLAAEQEGRGRSRNSAPPSSIAWSARSRPRRHRSPGSLPRPRASLRPPPGP